MGIYPSIKDLPSIKMDAFSRDPIIIIKRKVWDAKYIPMEICTSVITIKTRSMEKAPFFGLLIVKEMQQKKNILKLNNMRGCGGVVFLTGRGNIKK